MYVGKFSIYFIWASARHFKKKKDFSAGIEWDWKCWNMLIPTIAFTFNYFWRIPFHPLQLFSSQNPRSFNYKMVNICLLVAFVKGEKKGEKGVKRRRESIYYGKLENRHRAGCLCGWKHTEKNGKNISNKLHSFASFNGEQASERENIFAYIWQLSLE